MLIKIDFRETKLLELCAALATELENVKIVSENLPLGDIIICDDAVIECAIIERKSLADLAASIRDGRYKEQGFRLNACALHNHQIYYVVEGDLRFYKPFKGLPDKNALWSAMVSLSYYKGFSLQRTFNLAETAEWVLSFAKKLSKEGPSALPHYLGGSNDQQNYAEVVPKQRLKKEHITPSNIGEIMLAQIPSVSSAAAQVIMAKFSNMANLLTALQNEPTCLNALTIVNKSGQAKKIAKPCINNIVQFLLPMAVPLPSAVPLPLPLLPVPIAADTT
jgi:ERCC4-type nuclease